MRVFIAINLPNRIKEKLAKVQNQLKVFDLPIRWVNPENIHLTLVFLGEIKATEVTKVTEVTKATVSGFQSFQIEIKELGAFPDFRRPNCIWIGVKEGQHLLDLQSSLEKGLRGAGFSIEERKFSPHLTLGRIKNRIAKPKDMTEKFDENNIGKFQVEKVDIMESKLEENKRIYKVIEEISFKA